MTRFLSRSIAPESHRKVAYFGLGHTGVARDACA